MSEFFAVWTGKELVPAYEADLEVCQRYKLRQVIKLTGKQHRSNPMAALFWALMGYAHRIWPATAGTFRDKSALVDALLHEVGYVEEWWDIHGQRQTRVKSLSFAECDQNEFTGIFRQVLDLACGIIRCSLDELKSESLNQKYEPAKDNVPGFD